MVFSRRCFFIFCALVLSGNLVFAASTRDERALAVAQQTFNDNLFDRAENQLVTFIKDYPKSSRLPEARLLQAQAQYKQNKLAEAVQTLTAAQAEAGSLADRYFYWLGEAQFKLGRFSLAAEAFATVANNFPASTLRLKAAVEAAAAWEKTSDWENIVLLLGEAGGAFQRAMQTNAGNEMMVNGRLVLARAELAQKDFSVAIATLSALDAVTLSANQKWKQNSLLFSAKMATGETAAAMTLTTNLLALARSETNLDWQADASAKRSAVLKAMGLNAEASATLKENLSANAPLEKQREAILEIAALAALQKDFTNAETALEQFLATSAEAPVAELVRLTLGELHLKDFAASNHLAAALEQFNWLLNHAPMSSLAGKTYLGRGWANWLAEKYEPALADFKNAATRLPLTNDLAVAIFKAADSEFQLKQFGAALDDYQLVLERFTNFPTVIRTLGDRALYQMVRANLELKDRAGAQSALKQLLARFPSTGMAEYGLLLTAEDISDFTSPTAARELLRQFTEKFADSPLRPQAEFTLAQTFEHERNWAAAVTNHDVWLKRFPTNDLLPQVAYAQAWANFQAGHEATAFLQFSNFAAQFPSSTNAPLALWWVADSLFRSRAFEAAEKNYESIYQVDAWKSSPLYYPAQMMAGRAAMNRQGYKDAEAHFVPLLNDSNCPATWQTQARFAYGAVLKQMPSADTNNPWLNLTTATNIYDQIFRANSTNEIGLRARGELAGCAAQLGDFFTATNVYWQVANSAFADATMRAHAKVGLGLTYEQIAGTLPAEQRSPFLKLAKQTYLDVVDSPVTHEREEVADEFWVKKAGLQVLPLLAADGENHDHFFTRMEKLLPQLKETFEKKRASLSAVKN